MVSAKLHIDGNSKNKDIQLISLEYQFNVKVNELGNPVSNVHGGIIDLSFKSVDGKDLIQWMLSEAGDKNGTIEVTADIKSKAFRTLKFSEARLVHFAEHFYEPLDMVTRIKISAQQINLEGVTHEIGKLRKAYQYIKDHKAAVAAKAAVPITAAYYGVRLGNEIEDNGSKAPIVNINTDDKEIQPSDNISEGGRGGSPERHTAFIPPVSRKGVPGSIDDKKNLAEEIEDGAEKGKQKNEKNKEEDNENEVS